MSTLAPVQTNREAWHDTRLGRFTASTIGKLMGQPRMTKEMTARAEAGAVFFGDGAVSLIAEKAAERVSGVREVSVANYSMKRGTVLEEAAIHLLSTYWQPIEGCPYLALGNNSGATPDGLVGKGSATLDIKCPEAITSILRFGAEVPDGDFEALVAWDKNYAWQIMHQAKCAGVTEAWLVYFTDRLPWTVISDEEREGVQQIIDFACERLNEGNLYPYEYTYGSEGFAFVARRFTLTPERSELIDRVLLAAEVECERMVTEFVSVLQEKAEVDELASEAVAELVADAKVAPPPTPKDVLNDCTTSVGRCMEEVKAGIDHLEKGIALHGAELAMRYLTEAHTVLSGTLKDLK